MEALILLIAAVWILAAALAAARRPPRPVAPVRPAPTRRIRADVPHLLYCYLRANQPGRIYYGISNGPESRHARHLNDPDDRWWIAQSTGVMVPIRWYPNRETARAAERAAIRAGALAGEDLANDHHNPVRRNRSANPGRSPVRPVRRARQAVPVPRR